MKNKKKVSMHIIAMLICFVCLILSTANFWLDNATINFVIWPMLLVAMAFNCLGTSIDNQKLLNRYLTKTSECMDWCWALISVEHKVRYMDLSLEIKDELIDFIEEQNSEIHENREKRLKAFNLSEDDL